ncbi:DUF4393 domain-containing protein [Niallia sp.]|uniref:DUF4393 domain-containing protein n=1 Tax=Niallia sp. TaxID=2837523 RepID=UPI00289A976D|nr:DUF4393 domain-containing protein [Niallia sp.]
MDDFFGLGKLSDNSVEVFKEIYPDLAQPALRKVGIALEATIDFTILPFKYLGMVSKKADLKIKKNLNNYQSKLDSIDSSEIGSVPPEIGVPILEELTRITNEELTEMYINLLVNASSVENSRYAHPSFLNVLKNLSADEAKIIQFLMVNSVENIFPIYVRYQKVRRSNGAMIPLTDNINDINRLIELSFPDNNNFYINNLISMGIIEARDLYYRFDEERYIKFEESIKEIKEGAEQIMQKMLEDEHKKGDLGNASELNSIWGHFKVTDYGNEFFKGIQFEN